MHSDDVRNTVKIFIKERFMIGMAGDSLSDSDSMLEKGIIDSTGVLELVGFLEETFGLKVDDEELVPENLETVSNVVSFVARKLGVNA